MSLSPGSIHHSLMQGPHDIQLPPTPALANLGDASRSEPREMEREREAGRQYRSSTHYEHFLSFLVCTCWWDFGPLTELPTTREFHERECGSICHLYLVKIAQLYEQTLFNPSCVLKNNHDIDRTNSWKIIFKKISFFCWWVCFKWGWTVRLS